MLSESVEKYRQNRGIVCVYVNNWIKVNIGSNILHGGPIKEEIKHLTKSI